MHKVLFLFAALVSVGCSGLPDAQSAFDKLAPPVVVNPYVVKRIPLCTTALNDAQRKKFQLAMDDINASFPLGKLSQVAPKKCLPLQPKVEIDPNFHRGGYTVPSLEHGFTLTLKSDNDCIMRHELIHYLGITKHGNADHEQPGAMIDGDRGTCQANFVDIALFTRAYTGKPSW